MEADMISQALRSRAQVLCMQEFLSEDDDPPVPSDHYDAPHREALSTALKEEQRCEDLLRDREAQLSKIRTLSAAIDPEKLKRAKELLRKKEELILKRDELHSLLKSKNVVLSDVLDRRNRVTDHDSKISFLMMTNENCERLRSDIESISSGKTSTCFHEND
ncbi:hypothetical protein ANCCAN_00397 [Ancylostoma caninum]|uniref:Uncharacterized protein n=1 Tax=Ancylostoma caninum TaxID=29170 RepID=A0A368HDN8_ANCCA|nr:hypothetical protein ANCCAN_00397 [Ancylostoma caninum]